ncbi:hypothetical protein C8Q74DRAFT_1364059 [Fomes fomentarius]|nr:hypothetical protein C8Q74DRAFT_1364059 [Fomes fomentarius]
MTSCIACLTVLLYALLTASQTLSSFQYSVIFILANAVLFYLYFPVIRILYACIAFVTTLVKVYKEVHNCVLALFCKAYTVVVLLLTIPPLNFIPHIYAYAFNSPYQRTSRLFRAAKVFAFAFTKRFTQRILRAIIPPIARAAQFIALWTTSLLIRAQCAMLFGTVWAVMAAMRYTWIHCGAVHRVGSAGFDEFGKIVGEAYKAAKDEAYKAYYSSAQEAESISINLARVSRISAPAFARDSMVYDLVLSTTSPMPVPFFEMYTQFDLLSAYYHIYYPARPLINTIQVSVLFDGTIRILIAGALYPASTTVVNVAALTSTARPRFLVRESLSFFEDLSCRHRHMIAASSMSSEDTTLASSSSECTLLDSVESFQSLDDIEDDIIAGGLLVDSRIDMLTVGLPVKIDWIAACDSTSSDLCDIDNVSPLRPAHSTPRRPKVSFTVPRRLTFKYAAPSEPATYSTLVPSSTSTELTKPMNARKATVAKVSGWMKKLRQGKRKTLAVKVIKRLNTDPPILSWAKRGGSLSHPRPRVAGMTRLAPHAYAWETCETGFLAVAEDASYGK